MASVKLIKFLDKYVGCLSCLFLSIFKIFEDKKINGLNNILLIQLWGLGETILTLPAIEALRQKYKKSSIDVLVTDRNKEVYFNNKNINNVNTKVEIAETGIKAIDVFAPLAKGGKMGLFGGAGVGKTILLTEILHNIVGRDKEKTVSIS